MTKITTIRGIMSRCRKAAKLLGQKWEVRKGKFLRLQDVEGSGIGEFCPITAAYFVETGKRVPSGNYTLAARELGIPYTNQLPGDIAMAADNNYNWNKKRRQQLRRTLLELTK